jgi:hypothetical protein
MFALKEDDASAQVTTLHKTFRDFCRSPGIVKRVKN